MKPARQPDRPNHYDNVAARLQAEREATREVTRELHEAVQAAKDAARDLRQAQKEAEEWTNGLRTELAQILRDQMVATGDKYIDAVGDKLEKGRDEAQRLVDDVRARLQSLQSRFITGVDDQQAMLASVVTGVMDGLMPGVFLDGEFLSRLSDIIIDKLELRSTEIQTRVGPLLIRTAHAGEKPGLYEGYRP